jgi:Ca2+-binding RTX toxin-like protein
VDVGSASGGNTVFGGDGADRLVAGSDDFLFGEAGDDLLVSPAVLPAGILVQTVAFNAVYSGMGLSTDLDKGLFDRFRSLPI